jgi:hypothetical protein
MWSNTALILVTVLPFLTLFILACSAFLIYKLWYKRRRGPGGKNDEEHFLLSSYSIEYNSSGESIQIQTQSDLNLIDKVKQERMQLNTKSRESAFVHLQFFIRSSLATSLRLQEHLSFIGANNLNLYRNWFLVKDNISNASKLVVIDYIKSSPKKLKLVDIAYSMKHDLAEMGQLIGSIFKTMKHAHVLSFDHVEVDFYNDRVLYVEGLSAEGSLRDFLYGTNPLENMTVKLKRIKTVVASPLPISTIQSFAKQILLGLVYLNRKLLFPVDTLHSGNVILMNKRKRCLITGYDNEIFAYKTKQDRLNDDFRLKLVKTYLIRSTSSGDAHKLKTEQEIKYAIQVLRFGLILIEMCTGVVIFLDKLILPKQSVVQTEIQNRYGRNNRGEANMFIGFLNLLFFNKNFANSSEEKYRKKCVIPRLEELLDHDFVKYYKLDAATAMVSSQGEIDAELDPSQIEFLSYIAGSREIKVKKAKKKPSRLSSFAFSKRLSVIEETEGIVSETSFVNNTPVSPRTPNAPTTSIAPPPPLPPPSPSVSSAPPLPPPPPPPAPFMNATPPPPPPPSLAASLPPVTSDRSSLLDNIRLGTKLKKTVTVDKSKPVF